MIGCFRRSALQAVGYWNPERLTEDIDITWALQRAGWQVRYEPHALVWILMPESLKGLWRQRLRWAEGGLQVLAANLNLLWTPRQWRLLPLMLEPLASLAWAYLLAALLLSGAVSGLRHLGNLGSWMILWPHGLTAALLITCLVQVLLSFWLDRPYDVGLRRIGFWMIWLPAGYWLLTFAASLRASLRWRARSGQQRARWISPDRGLRP